LGNAGYRTRAGHPSAVGGGPRIANPQDGDTGGLLRSSLWLGIRKRGAAADRMGQLDECNRHDERGIHLFQEAPATAATGVVENRAYVSFAGPANGPAPGGHRRRPGAARSGSSAPALLRESMEGSAVQGGRGESIPGDARATLGGPPQRSEAVHAAGSALPTGLEAELR